MSRQPPVPPAIDVLHLSNRFLEGVGLAACALDEAAAALTTYQRGPKSEFHQVADKSSPEEALGFLSTLTIPATRHLLFAVGDRLTCMINNARNGSDYSDDVHHLPRHLRCEFARVVNCQNKIWRRGRLCGVQKYGARVFDLHDASGETIRSVACVNDGGRWVFDSAGQHHPIEASFEKLPARRSARFPAQELSQLSAAYGFPLPTPSDFSGAGRYLLFTQHLHIVVSCTLDEQDDPAYSFYLRGLHYVPHLATHAQSVVADFERCLAINPNYESKVRHHLQAAKAVPSGESSSSQSEGE